jgi:hypothetical protein
MIKYLLAYAAVRPAELAKGCPMLQSGGTVDACETVAVI